MVFCVIFFVEREEGNTYDTRNGFRSGLMAAPCDVFCQLPSPERYAAVGEACQEMVSWVLGVRKSARLMFLDFWMKV